MYRLLGCDLTYHGGLPCREKLCYDIHITGHLGDGDVRLFFSPPSTTTAASTASFA